MKVDRKMMPQATEKWTLSREREYHQRPCVEIRCSPANGPEGMQNIFGLLEVPVNDISQDRAEHGIENDVSRVKEGLCGESQNIIFLGYLLLAMTAPRAETRLCWKEDSERDDWM